VGAAAGAGERRAAAALLLAGAVALAAFAPRRAPDPACAEPRAEAGARVRCGGAPGTAPAGSLGLLFGLPLDPNTAAPAALEVLPGIGPARAAAIAAERCRAPFASLAELERVPGIGPRTRERLAPFLHVAAAPQPAGCAPVQ
jgi:hypothetical protein